MTDWNKIAVGDGKLGEVDVRMLLAVSDNLLFAVRDSFDVNEVPPEVVTVLRMARFAIEDAARAVSAVGVVMTEHYAAQGLKPDGSPPSPEEAAAAAREEQEVLRADDIRRRSSHRPD